MFKKIFIVFSVSAFLSTLSFATDLLAFYTNGKLTEKSPGVKVLSLEEKKQVKGGLNIGPEYYHLAQFNNYGERISYTQYWIVTPEEEEKRRGALKVDNRYSTSDYLAFQWFTVVDPQNEVVTIRGHYDFKSKQIYTSFVILNKKTLSHRYVNHPLATTIFNAAKDFVSNQVYNGRYNQIR